MHELNSRFTIHEFGFHDSAALGHTLLEVQKPSELLSQTADFCTEFFMWKSCDSDFKLTYLCKNMSLYFRCLHFQKGWDCTQAVWRFSSVPNWFLASCTDRKSDFFLHSLLVFMRDPVKCKRKVDLMLFRHGRNGCSCIMTFYFHILVWIVRTCPF